VSVNLFVSHIRAVIAVTGFAIHTVIGVTKFANVAKQTSAASWLALGSLYFFDAMTGAGGNYWGPPKEDVGRPLALAGNGDILVRGKRLGPYQAA
jgi:hypothetical protein